MKKNRKIPRILVPFYLAGAALFLFTLSTGAHFYDSERSVDNSLTAATWTATAEETATAESSATVTSTPDSLSIVINEFLANPSAEPESTSEWVELYNKGGGSVDINGWVLYDASDSHALPISSSNVAGGSTIVNSGGFALVNRNGDADFSLNNSGVETVRLYNGPIGIGTQIDSHTYSGTITDKTWAKVPDGTGSWTNNHTPTPGGPNV